MIDLFLANCTENRSFFVRMAENAEISGFRLFGAMECDKIRLREGIYLSIKEEFLIGQKDITEKTLEAYNDVFSDIVNVLLFDGEEVVKAGELEEQAPRTSYQANGKYREIERDIAKRWKQENIRLACIGFENQSGHDADMPLRVIGYDGAEYRAQLNDKTQKERYPVVTLVLYFGEERRWEHPLSLVGCLEIPDKLASYVSDYKINLFEVAYLDPEKVKLFKSDFGIVADYLVQKQRTGTYVGSTKALEHAQETLALMSVMTGDSRFEDTFSEAKYENGKEIKNMCEVLDRIEERGIAIGEERGIAIGEVRGEERGAFRVMYGLVSDGLISVKEAVKRLGISEEEFARKVAERSN